MGSQEVGFSYLTFTTANPWKHSLLLRKELKYFSYPETNKITIWSQAMFTLNKEESKRLHKAPSKSWPLPVTYVKSRQAHHSVTPSTKAKQRPRRYWWLCYQTHSRKPTTSRGHYTYVHIPTHTYILYIPSFWSPKFTLSLVTQIKNKKTKKNTQAYFISWNIIHLWINTFFNGKNAVNNTNIQPYTYWYIYSIFFN